MPAVCSKVENKKKHREWTELGVNTRREGVVFVVRWKTQDGEWRNSGIGIKFSTKDLGSKIVKSGT